LKGNGFIREHAGEFEVEEMCEALEISRSSYYRWRNGTAPVRKQDDERYKEAIMLIHKKARGRYGHRPIYEHLRDQQLGCGRDRTLRLMKELNIQNQQKKRFRALGTDSNHAFGYSANLLKDLGEPTGCDQAWVADTTYLRTQGGWMYLATVMDLFSRRILGWSVSAQNDRSLVCEALKGAVLSRGHVAPGIIHHSDRGSTYASDKYMGLLARFKMKSSMSAKGNCYDNAAMESFYGRYKTSSVRDYVFTNDRELRANVFDYIEVFYNRFRKHASLGYKCPSQIEEIFSPPMGGRQDPSCLNYN
jgi:putative transposase